MTDLSVNMILNDSDVRIAKKDDDYSSDYMVVGSKDTDYLQELAELEKSFESKTEDLNQRFMAIRGTGRC